MKKLFIPILAAAVVIMSASCSKSSSSSTPQAQVMFVNGWLGNSALNVTATGTAKAAYTSNGLQFLKNTGYQNVTAAVATNVMFSQPSTSTLIIDSTGTFTANTHYSVYIGGVITSPVEIFTTDDVSAPPSGMAKVRFINLSPDTVSYNIYAGTVAVATGVRYKAVTSFVNVPESTGNILIQNPNNPPQQTVLANQNFSAGKIYTVMFTGILTGTGTAVPTITLINNN